MATRVPQPRTTRTQARVLSRRSRLRSKIEGSTEKPRPTIPQSHPSRRGNKENRTTSCRAYRPKTLENLAQVPDKRPGHDTRLGEMGSRRTLYSCSPLSKVQGRHGSGNRALKLSREKERQTPTSIRQRHPFYHRRRPEDSRTIPERRHRRSSVREC